MQQATGSDDDTSPTGESIAQLGRIAAETDYTQQRLGELLGSLPPYNYLDLPHYRRIVASPSRQHTLIKLFALGDEVDRDEATQALDPLKLADLVRLRLLEAGDGKTVRPLLALDPYQGLVLTRDLRDRTSEEVAADYVLGINPPSMNLANLTVRRPTSLALDLGSGCGVQGLLASRHCQRVIGVDTNPRALQLAALNADINGISNVEWRQGSLFEPVEDMRFDLIVSNPPYVISPENSYEFRDNDQPDDAFCRSLVQESCHRLREGGFATIFCNWIHPANGDWSKPLRSWLEGGGCDAWIIHFGSQDPLGYAAAWNRSSDPTAYDERVESWMAYYGQRGIEAIGLGAIILRRRSGGENWLCTDDLPDAKRLSQASDQILGFFRGQDYLTATSEAAMLADRFRLTADHQLLQKLAVRELKYAVESMALRTRMPMPFTTTIDVYELAILTQCDGRQTLEDIVLSVAKSSKRGRLEVKQEAADLARRLLRLGFLEPACWDPESKR